MSRGGWGLKRGRTHAVGVCLLHRRPIPYAEGRRKGCISRRRCKWFRAPEESGLLPEPPESESCPHDTDELEVGKCRT